MNYKKKANITLILLSISFISVSIIKYFYHGIVLLDLIFAILEASLIGGMADWFAVTAIFKKPLGFPFHTAIIPNNRKAIVNSVVDIVEKEFLSTQILNQRLNKINMTQKLLNWVDNNNGKVKLNKLISSYLNDNITDENINRLHQLLLKIGNEGIKRVDFDGYINSFIEWSVQSGEYKHVFFYILDNFIKYVEGPDIRSKIYTIIDNLKAEKTQGLFGAIFNGALESSNLINVDEITDSIHMQLIHTLYNLKDEETLESKHIIGILEEHLLLSVKNPFDDNIISALKEFIVENIITTENITKIFEEIKISLSFDNKASSAELTAQFEKSGMGILMSHIDNIYNILKQNEVILTTIEDFIKKTIKNTINREHSVIGNIVRDTLDSFSDAALNEFIEVRAGNDLQWIRINGSIVGGMVGLLVFLFLRLFYDPIAVPFIKHLFL